MQLDRIRHLEGFCRLIARVLIVVTLGVLLLGARQSLAWDFESEVEVGTEFESNVFRLTDDQLDRFEENRAVDQTTGRFSRMDSDWDVHFPLSVEGTWTTKGLKGRDLELSPRVSYDFYSRNSKKSHPEFGFSIDQRLARKGRLSLDFEYTLGKFRRNYLVGAGGTGSRVRAVERDYDAGIRDDLEITLTHRHRLLKPKGKKRSLKRISLFAESHLGFVSQEYRGDLTNRSAEGFVLGTRAEIAFGRLLEVGVGYEFGWLFAPATREFFLLDEPAVSLDFNNDGDRTDNNLRAFERVDRTRQVHDLEIDLGLQLDRKWRLPFSYGFRVAEYTSDERFDFRNRNRRDVSHKIESGVEWRIAKAVRLTLLGFWVTKDRSRDALSTNDGDGSYDNFGSTFSIRISL